MSSSQRNGPVYIALYVGRWSLLIIQPSVAQGQLNWGGDSTMRPRRGWIAHFLAALVGVASVNVVKISAWLKQAHPTYAQDGIPSVKPEKHPLRRRERTAGFTRGDDPPDQVKAGKVS